MLKRFSIHTQVLIHSLILGLLLFTPLMSEADRYDNDTSLNYSWEPASGSVDHYNVYVSVDNSDFEMVGTTSTPDYTLKDTNDLSTYRLKVQAVDAFGNTGPFSDTSDATTVALPVQMPLSAGYNLIALPYTPKTPVTSHNIIRDMGIQLVSRWDSGTQTWDSVMRLPSPISADGTILGNDFPITPFMGIYVQVAANVKLTFDGTPPDLSTGIPLKPGQNLISIPDRSTAYTSYTLLNDMPSQWVTRWRVDTQLWDSATMVDKNPIGTDFPIQAGSGYFVQVSNSSVWTPQPALAAPGRPIAITPSQPRSAERNRVEGLLRPHAPRPIYGQIYRYDGVTPARGATVSIGLIRQGNEVAHTDTTVDSNGYWIADISDGQPEDEVRIVAKQIDGSEGTYPPFSVLEDKVPQFVGSLILQVRPDVSKLLANYPNPFNPETWIPFQIRHEGIVTVSIHDISGKVVKSLDLGFRGPGYYVSKHQAAYWDGTNESGEKVASGLYFYTIRAAEFRSTRKMLLLK